MKVTVVVDNIENGGIPGEWGLCMHIEYREKRLLLDTGASGLFADNAERMHISLGDIDAAVLSHAHGDHAKGMEKFFQGVSLVSHTTPGLDMIGKREIRCISSIRGL